jgi:glycosyltransferase involved in cell wall biosynthesis
VQIFNGREREALRELVACADVVIAPSLAEGFGSVHSEVCAMGKPLITTQVSAIPEVVSGKVIFVQAGCSQALVQGIETVRKGERTTIPPKHFSRENNVEHIMQWYE